MTEPTDALLPCPFCGEAAKHSFNSLYGDMSMASCKSCGATAYAPKWNRRAVLAKWGTPSAAEGEPECTCSAKDAPFGTCCKVRSAFERWYDEQNYGRLQPFDVFKGGWIERHRLSSTPQPTQTQAVAEPLTDEQLAEMMRETWGCASIAPRHAMKFARAIEAAHGIGIKGGQHG